MRIIYTKYIDISSTLQRNLTVTIVVPMVNFKITSALSTGYKKYFILQKSQVSQIFVISAKFNETIFNTRA